MADNQVRGPRGGGRTGLCAIGKEICRPDQRGDALDRRRVQVLLANAEDMLAVEAKGLSPAMLDGCGWTMPGSTA